MTFGQQSSEVEAHELLSHAQERGVNFYDTSELYPVAPAAETQGLSSQYMGSWLKVWIQIWVVLAGTESLRGMHAVHACRACMLPALAMVNSRGGVL